MAFTLVNGTDEQTIVELAQQTSIVYISMDFSDVIGPIIIKEYEKIDGLNYALVSTAQYPADFAESVNGVSITHAQLNCSYKVTLTTQVPEGADKSIPYRYGVELR